jgi:antitoxin (DNA-binding transcriptional repressor) of toxin-antitoxin stability system
LQLAEIHGLRPAQVNIHEAKTHLSRLIAAIKSGKETEIIMAKNGVPGARIGPIEAGPSFRRKPIRFGLWRARYGGVSGREGLGGGYDGVQGPWIRIIARKPEAP